MAGEGRSPGGRVGREVAFTGLLLLSGAAALVHETAWFRVLVPVLGAGVASAAAVSAGALLGLSVGAALGGRLADRLRRPALAFVVAEGLASAACLVVPRLLPLLEGLPGAAGPVAAALLLAVAAVPMGGSLPAAVRAIAPPDARVAACFRRVYGWNTVGAVLGVAASTLVLLERFGNLGAIAIASAAQAVVAVAALLLARPGTSPAAAPPGPGPRTALDPRLLAAAFLAGLAGLVVQIAWVRRLAPAMAPTFQVFALVLALHLLALALGTLLLGPRRGERARTLLPLLALVAAVPVALLPAAVGWVARWSAERVFQAEGDLLAIAGARAAGAAMVLVPSVALGAALLPWLLRAAAPTTERAGSGSGRLLAANTAGSALGALATALLWIPAVGTAAALRGAAGVYLAAGALMAPRRGAAAALALGALVLLVQPFVVDVGDAAGRDAVGASYSPDYDPADSRALLFEEGPVATVLVRDAEGRLEFWIDGSVEASLGPTDRLHLALLGHLPMALLAGQGTEGARVAVIGLGAGITTQAVARWGPSEVVVHEIEPAVVRVAAAFGADGGGVPAVARVSIGDGRRGVQRSRDPLDLVTSDPVHPATAGSAYLYSVEHYRALADRLGPGGLVCEWLPLYQMEVEDLRLVARTFAAAFEAPYLFLAGVDGVLVGARRPLRVSEERLRAALSSDAGAPLAALGLRAPGRLLGLLVKGPDAFRRFAGRGPLNTDDRLLLEFRAGRGAATTDPGGNAKILSIGRADPSALLDAPPGEAFLEELAEARRFSEGTISWAVGDFERGAEVFRDRAARDPEDLLARRLRDDCELRHAHARWSAGDAEGAARIAREVLARGEAEPTQRLDAAELLEWAGFADEAREEAREVLRRGDWPRARRLAGEER